VILTVTLNPCLDKSLFIDRNAPAETIRATGVRDLAGGKGVNVSRALVRLGEEVCTLMPLGGHAGAWVADLAREEGLRPRAVPIAGGTRCALTLQETGTGQTWHYLEPGPPLTTAEVEALKTCYDESLAAAELVILSGSLPRPELAALIPWMTARARDAGLPAIVDSHGPGLTAALTARPWMVKPNREELAAALGEPLLTADAQWNALRRLRETGIEVVVLSLGAEGARAQWGDERWEVTPPAVSEVNALGAGDSMVAGIAHAWRRGLSPREALAWGAACGAANTAVWDPGGFTRAAAEALLPQVRIVEASAAHKAQRTTRGWRPDG
jgi:1-phosphofructokinase family hexose kinase